MYELFYDGDEPPAPPKKMTTSEARLFGNSGREQRELTKLRKFLSEMEDRDRHLLLKVAAKMASQGNQ
jgi:hypothetical protein